MITCIVIADKFKKGMKSQGCAGLLPYKKSVLFQQQYSTIKSVFPKSNIVYVYGFDSKRFSSFMHNESNHKDLICIPNKAYDRYGHGYSLSLCKDHIKASDQCLILFGYDQIDKNLLSTIKKRSKHSLAIINRNSHSRLGCTINNDQVNHIFFDLANPVADVYFLMQPEVGKLLEVLDYSDKTYNLFLFEIINHIILHNGIIKPVFIGDA